MDACELADELCNLWFLSEEGRRSVRKGGKMEVNEGDANKMRRRGKASDLV